MPEPSKPPSIRLLFNKLIFLPPSQLGHPEREALTEMFRSGVEKYLKNQACSYEELNLTQLPKSNWRKELLSSVNAKSVLIFSYTDEYADFFSDMSVDDVFKNALFVLAMPSAETIRRLGEGSRVYLIKFKMQELGFLGGVIAGQKTLTGKVALFAFEGEQDSDSFVAGFAQGLRFERSGSSIHDLRLRRAELSSKDLDERLKALYSEASRKHDPRFGIDVVVSFLGGSAEGFFRGLALSDTAVITTFKVDESKGPDAFMTSLILDFSLLPKFLAEKFSGTGISSAKSVTPSKEGLKGNANGLLIVGAGTESPGESRVLEVGIKEGLITSTSFKNYQRFHSVPSELASTLAYYINSISKGELEVTESPPKE